MWGLTSNGDLDVSSNGVIRTISGLAITTYQSANVLIGTVKGSYPYVPDMGLDINTILSARVDSGTKPSDNVEYLTELLIATELEKDPNISTVQNFVFETDPLDRTMTVTFEITTVESTQLITLEI